MSIFWLLINCFCNRCQIIQFCRLKLDNLFGPQFIMLYFGFKSGFIYLLQILSIPTQTILLSLINPFNILQSCLVVDGIKINIINLSVRKDFSETRRMQFHRLFYCIFGKVVYFIFSFVPHSPIISLSTNIKLDPLSSK